MARIILLIIGIIVLFGQFASAREPKMMNDHELDVMIGQQVELYKAVVHPENQIATKKFLRTPLDYVGQVVVLRAKCATGLGPREGLLDIYTTGSGGMIAIQGVRRNSPILKSVEEGCLLIGQVNTHPAHKLYITSYMLCSIISDTKAHKNEVDCEVQVSP